MDWADKYFSKLLYATEWHEATPEEKEKALATAERDIGTLNLVRPPLRAYRAAICEQALYLLQQTEGDRNRVKLINQGVASRSVGGASETYRHNQRGYISETAMQIISPWARRRTGGIR